MAPQRLRPRSLLGTALAAGLAAVLALAGATAAAAGTHTGNDPAVTITVDDQVVAGEPIHVSGTGWVSPTPGVGSVVAIKVDSLSTTQAVANPATGTVIANKGVWAAVQADADGTWSAELPYPSSAVTATPWTGTGAHTLTLLTGSLLPGDTVRSETATFEVVAATTPPVVTTQPVGALVTVGDPAAFTAAASGAPAPAVQWQSAPAAGDWADVPGATGGTLTVASATLAASGTRYRAVFTSTAGTATSAEAVLTVAPPAGALVGSSDPTVTFTVPGQVVVGEAIHLSGTGWTTPAGVPSVIAVKLDDGAVGTTRTVTHPVTGAVQGNTTIWAMVQAQADGSWSADVPFPTTDGSTLTTAWAAGETHSVRLLTSSPLTAGDRTRTETASFTLVAAAPGAGPADPPAWAHETVRVGAATAWVEQGVAAGDGATLRVKGYGWTDAAGTTGSTIALKVNRGEGLQYTRSGSGVVQHPTAAGDDTIWALLAADASAGQANVHPIAADGSFDLTLDAPAGLVAGQYLTVSLQSGRFLAGDVQRTATTAPLVVGGVAWVDPGDGGEQVTCVPTSGSPTVTVAPDATVGGTLHVTGTGWCHPAENGGGSRIGVKIDEGAYSRLDTSVHTNRTIWATVDADPRTGTFDVEIPLPDGTTTGAAGSDPAFPEGSHTLRLLTGSLKSGDTVRTLLSAPFVVGEYRPNGLPDPAEATEDLTSATRGGVTLSRTATALTVRVPAAQPGDWVFLTAYAVDGSPRYLWRDTWFRVGADGTVVAPLAGVTLPVGTTKLAVQSGNRGSLGQVLGWASLHVAAPPAPEVPATGGTAAPGTSGGTGSAGTGAGTGGAAPVTVTAATTASTAAPTEVPPPPFGDDTGLTAANAGDVVAAQEGTVVTLTLAGVEPGAWVYLYTYSEPLAVGWVQVDAHRQVRVDLGLLAPGDHKIAVLDADGGLIGWAAATVPGEVEAEAAPEADAAAGGSVTAAGADEVVTTDAVPTVAESGGLSGADWWFVAGGAVLLVVLVGVGLRLRRRPGAAA